MQEIFHTSSLISTLASFHVTGYMLQVLANTTRARWPRSHERLGQILFALDVTEPTQDLADVGSR